MLTLIFSSIPRTCDGDDNDDSAWDAPRPVYPPLDVSASSSSVFFPCLSPGGDRPDESCTPGPVVSHAFILQIAASRPSRAIRNRFSLGRLVTSNRRLFVLLTPFFFTVSRHRRAGHSEKSPPGAAEIAAAVQFEFGDTLKVRFFSLLLSCPKRSIRLTDRTQTAPVRVRSHNLSLQVHNVGFSSPPPQRRSSFQRFHRFHWWISDYQW